jgi:LPS-assembly lipoprotein
MGKQIVVAAALLLAAPVLSACGFSPLYGRSDIAAVPGQQYASLVRDELSRISIDPIPNRLGLTMRNNLLDLLTPDGEPASPAYKLSVVLHERSEGLAIQEDSSITRYNYRLRAQYVLTDVQSGAVVQSGEESAVAAYNVADSQFATLSAEKDVRARTARELSQILRLRLGIGFERRARTTG